jgi:hypothetical protein
MEWLWMYAAGLFWPMTLFGVVVIAGAAILFDINQKKNRGLEWGNPKYQDVSRANWTIANIVGIYAILWMLAAAVPDPKPRIQIIEKPVEKIVEKVVTRVVYKDGVEVRKVYPVPSYKAVFENCAANMIRGNIKMSLDETKECHSLAAQASLPPARVIRSVTTIRQKVPYQEVFDNCVRYIAANDSAETLARNNTCHAKAMEASKL